MNCRPSPEESCGTLLNDSCIVITGTWPFPCSQPVLTGCYRQSEFNQAAGEQICLVYGYTYSILGSITGSGENPTLVTGLKNCDNSAKTPTTIQANFQTLYTQICDLKADLSLPLNGAVKMKCLRNDCCTPIATLGELLQALVDAYCCLAAKVPSASGCVSGSC
jgi:hypothetical protein